MVAAGMPTLPDYLRYLARHAEEYSRLIASFLIHVTEFFRDPKLFVALRDEILPELIADNRTETMGNELRIWRSTRSASRCSYVASRLPPACQITW